MSTDIPKYVYLDIETTIKYRAIIEFGCIVVDGDSLNEIERYETLVKPEHLYSWCIPNKEITIETLRHKPPFLDVSIKIFDLLNNNIWIGHNIQVFDCPIIDKHFKNINMISPKPKSIIDTFRLIKSLFPNKLKNYKLETISAYYGINDVKHRALSDCIVNKSILECIACDKELNIC
jgi:DNA polymerase III epsilon subunit-like protein